MIKGNSFFQIEYILILILLISYLCLSNTKEKFTDHEVSVDNRKYFKKTYLNYYLPDGFEILSQGGNPLSEKDQLVFLNDKIDYLLKEVETLPKSNSEDEDIKLKEIIDQQVKNIYINDVSFIKALGQAAFDLTKIKTSPVFDDSPGFLPIKGDLKVLGRINANKVTEDSSLIFDETIFDEAEN